MTDIDWAYDPDDCMTEGSDIIATFHGINLGVHRYSGYVQKGRYVECYYGRIQAPGLPELRTEGDDNPNMAEVKAQVEAIARALARGLGVNT